MFLTCDTLMKAGKLLAKSHLCIKGPRDFWGLIQEKQTGDQLRKIVSYSLEWRKVRADIIAVFHYLQVFCREDAAFSSQRHTAKGQEATITSYNKKNFSWP